MTLEEELEIYERIKKGDGNAHLEIVAANCEKIYPIARSLAKEGNKWTPDDLYQEAAMAMVRFAERWKPQPGIPFWAAVRPRVRGSMKDFLRRKADAVRNQREQPLSLDASSADDPDGRTLGETMSDGSAAVHDRFELPDTLTQQERAVVELLLFSETPMSIGRIAQKLEIQERSVLRAHRLAMKKMEAA